MSRPEPHSDNLADSMLCEKWGAPDPAKRLVGEVVPHAG